MRNTQSRPKVSWSHIKEIDRDYLSKHQHEELIKATTSRVGILSGVAGAGKTTTLAFLLKNIKGDPVIGVAAPTGKASVRAKEVLSEHGLNVFSSTIHRMLAACYSEGEATGWEFKHNASNPMPYNVVIIDEAPMIPTALMAQLFDAIHPDALVLLVGDTEQLPPIGHGKPYLDLIEAGVPHGHLTEVWRNAGRIAQACQQIRNGQKWETSPALDLHAEFPENFLHLERRYISKISSTLLTASESLQGKNKDIIRDLQIVCPLRSKGDLSTTILNKTLQPHFNPDGTQFKGLSFRIGDKVICTRNGYRPIVVEDEQPHSFMLDDDDEPQDFISNGDTGIIQEIHEGKMYIDFFNKEYTTIFHKADWSQNIELAYAVTCHKMQGSQAPIIISIIDPSYGANMVSSRSYHYTACTRAESILFTVGMKAAMEAQCQKVDVHGRKTFLVKRIKKCRMNNQKIKSNFSSNLIR